MNQPVSQLPMGVSLARLGLIKSGLEVRIEDSRLCCRHRAFIMNILKLRKILALYFEEMKGQVVVVAKE